ncbi:MAG: cation-translocating P-type ATPase [Syntrophomonadaceae bacterium]|nr:cation-translocating P-type ATPase [Syntrophomonadaceae bacterium]MDD3022309.1 cation-translocating P-type ATPase [Syntrophomonadaceae bacterium]
MSGMIINIEDISDNYNEERIKEDKQQAAEVTVIRLEGLDCADCAAKLEKRISSMPGVEEASVNYGAAKMKVTHRSPVDDIFRVIENLGYHGRTEGDVQSPAETGSFWTSNKYGISTLMSGAMLLLAIGLQTFEAPIILRNSAFLLAIALGGYLPARAGISMLVNTRELDMNFLMILAAAGAVAIGEFSEGAVVVFLFSLGNALQAHTMDKTRGAIRSLMELAPQEALVRRGAAEKIISVGEIRKGDIIIIRPGERIAMDGKVIKGASAVDQAAITGESIPVDKNSGDHVYAGTLNGYGALEIKVEKLVKDNTIARIISMVEEAQGQKAPSQNFVDRFARWYTPAVIIAAVLVAALPPLLWQEPLKPWFYEALAMLLVACPCALIISTPVSIVSALGSAARQGVLIKGGIHLEQSGQIKVIAFDKTGTLTLGRPEVKGIYPCTDYDENIILSLAAAIESRSEHPLAEAIVSYSQGKQLMMPPVDNFQAVPGKGAYAELEGQRFYVGSLRFLMENNLDINPQIELINSLEDAGNTLMMLADEKKVLGIIALSDSLRANSRESISQLKKLGIQRTVMLSGDNEAVARAISAQAGVDDYRAELLPEDKVQVMKELLARHEKVAMVGDGVNDAPALAISTVGIAMGAAGSDAALETADIALMSDDLSKLAYTIELGRRTVNIIRQNIIFSLVIKAAILLLVIPGWLTLWLAVVGDMGTSLLVTLNGMRLKDTRGRF